MRALLVACLAVFTAASALADTRVALVIANAKYTNVPALSNPLNDSGLIADTLRKVGFRVTVKSNLGKAALEKELKDFGRSAADADVALVYYAGHGMEMGGTNYLVPVDATLANDGDVDFEAVPLPLVLHSVEGANRLRLVILDACRNNPFKMQKRDGTRAIVSRGLARVEPSGDTLVVYAAKEGTTADDGSSGNSPFARAFSSEIAVPGQEVQFVFRKVRDDVMKSTGRRQEPMVYGALGGTAYYFTPPNASSTAAGSGANTHFDPKQVELALWHSVESSNDANQYQSYLDQYPNGTFAAAAKAKIAAQRKTVRVSSVSPQTASQYRSDPRQYLADAQQLLKKGDFAKTVDLLSAAISEGRLTPEQSRIAYMSRGKAYFWQGNYTAAADDFSEVNRQDPSDMNAKGYQLLASDHIVKTIPELPGSIDSGLFTLVNSAMHVAFLDLSDANGWRDVDPWLLRCYTFEAGLDPVRLIKKDIKPDTAYVHQYGSKCIPRVADEKAEYLRQLSRGTTADTSTRKKKRTK